jgi:hypothetical protein
VVASAAFAGPWATCSVKVASWAVAALRWVAWAHEVGIHRSHHPWAAVAEVPFPGWEASWPKPGAFPYLPSA